MSLEQFIGVFCLCLFVWNFGLRPFFALFSDLRENRKKEAVKIRKEEFEREKPTLPSITHFACRARSYNPNDIKKHYCGRCHRFLDEGEFAIARP